MRAKLFLLLAMAGTVVGCHKDDNDIDGVNYSESKKALLELYPTADNISWSTSNGYQIANYYYSIQDSKSSKDRNSTSWFVVDGTTSTIKKTVQDYDQNIYYLPTVVQEAFNASEYSNTSLWVIDEIELENDFYDDSDDNYVFQFELNSAQGITPKQEAELYFDGNTGTLLFSKVSMSDDDDDDDDDYVVINDKIIQSVNNYLSSSLATGESILIVSAEMDDNMIEVDVAIMNGSTVVREVELMLNPTTYEVNPALTETEETYTYNTLPDEFKTPIMFWFAGEGNVNDAPVPSVDVQVTVEKYTENNVQYAEVEFEYSGWEAEFKFSYTNDTWTLIESESEVEKD